MKRSITVLAFCLCVMLTLTPTFVISEQAAVFEIELPAAASCEVCGGEHIILPCGGHSICDAEITQENYAAHMRAECGEHYVCEENYLNSPERHETRGKACQEYMCHSINADYHTRCKHCGGPLCYNRHGQGVCYDFGYNYRMDLLNGRGNDGPQPTTGRGVLQLPNLPYPDSFISY